MKQTGKVIDNRPITYKVDSNGYTIYLDGTPWIDQHEPYGKPMSKEKSYEENCLMQIDDLVRARGQEKNIEEQLEEATTQITDLQLAIVELYEMLG